LVLTSCVTPTEIVLGRSAYPNAVYGRMNLVFKVYAIFSGHDVVSVYFIFFWVCWWFVYLPF
nr:hypothetical protein [Candidatus Freyarchaeota archaeon]